MAKQQSLVERNSYFIEAIKERERQKGRTALERASRDILGIINEDINKMFSESVSAFYSDYAPRVYERRNGGKGSMYDILSTRTDNSSPVPSLIITMDESGMGGYRSGYKGEDGLFTTVFIEGWHGGAEREGYADKKFWRTPVNGYYMWGEEADRADISPYDDFVNKVTAAAEGEWTQKYHALIKKHRDALK